MDINIFEKIYSSLTKGNENIRASLAKIKSILADETRESNEMLKIYQKYVTNNEKITKEELEVAKSTLTGSYQVWFDSNSGLADGILNSVVVWNDLSYVDDYIKKVNEVSLKQVNDAIKKYIKPEEIFQVAAGSIDEEGKPLAKEED